MEASAAYDERDDNLVKVLSSSISDTDSYQACWFTR